MARAALRRQRTFVRFLRGDCLERAGITERREGLAEMADSLLPDGTQVSLQRAALDALNIPVKVIWGTADRVVPYHQSAGLPARVALHSMAGIGHLPQVEATDTVAALVREQVAAARDGGR